MMIDIDIDIDIIYTFICSHAEQRNGLERGLETFAKLMAIQVSKLIPRWEATTRVADVSRFKAKTVGDVMAELGAFGYGSNLWQF